MLVRFPLAFALLFAAATVHAQAGLTVIQVGQRLTILNETAAPVTFDSLRIASVEIGDGPYTGSTSARYVASLGGDIRNGSFYCSPFHPGPLCREGQPVLSGNALAPGDSVRFTSFEVFCDVCRPDVAPGRRDTMRVYSGGVAVPFNVAMPSELYVAGDATPEASAVHLGVAPNPVHGTVTMTFAQPALGAVRVAAFDALGRTVALLHDGPADEMLILRVDTALWPPSVYVVRAETAGRVAAVRLVVAR